MKKLIISLLCVVIALSLFACKSINGEKTETDTSSADSETVVTSDQEQNSADDDSTTNSTFEETKYIVTLILNGGTIADNKTTVEVVYGKNYDLGTPKKEDNEFVGWYNGEQMIESSGVWQYNEGMTLTAKWQYAWSPTV